MNKKRAKCAERVYVQVQIDPEMKQKFSDKLAEEGKTMTEAVLAWIENYLSGDRLLDDSHDLRSDVAELKEKMATLEKVLMGESAA